MISSSSNKSKKFRPFNQIQDNETIRVNSTNKQQNPQLLNNNQVAQSNIELKINQKSTQQINSEQQDLETEKSTYSFRPIQKYTRKIQQKQNSENKLPKLDKKEQAQKNSEKYQNTSEKTQQYKKQNLQSDGHQINTDRKPSVSNIIQNSYNSKPHSLNQSLTNTPKSKQKFYSQSMKQIKTFQNKNNSNSRYAISNNPQNSNYNSHIFGNDSNFKAFDTQIILTQNPKIEEKKLRPQTAVRKHYVTNSEIIKQLGSSKSQFLKQPNYNEKMQNQTSIYKSKMLESNYLNNQNTFPYTTLHSISEQQNNDYINIDTIFITHIGQIEHINSVKPLQFQESYYGKNGSNAEKKEYLISSQAIKQFLKKSNPETSTYGNQIIKIVEQYFFKWAQKLKQILQLFRQEIIDRANSFEKVHFEDMISDLNKINKVTKQLNEQAEILISVYNKLETQKILDQTKKQNTIACSLYLCLELVSSIQNSILKDLEQDYQEDKISQKNSVIYQYNSSNNSTNNISNSNKQNIISDKIQQKNTFQQYIQIQIQKYSNKVKDKQFYQEFIQAYKEFLLNFENQGDFAQKTFAQYYRFYYKVGHLSKVNLLDPNSYDIDEATETFTELLPQSNQIIQNLNELQDQPLLSTKLKIKAKRGALITQELQEKMEKKLKKDGIQILLEIFEDKISKNIYINLNSTKFFDTFPDFVKINQNFLLNISQESDEDNQQKIKQFQKHLYTFIDLVEECKQIFIQKIKQKSISDLKDGVLYLDSKLTEKFLSEIHENCIEYQNKYKEIWDLVIQIRKEINMQTDLFEDRNLITKEVEYIQDLIYLGENINQLNNNPLKTEDPPNIVIQDEDQRQQSIKQHQKKLSEILKDLKAASQKYEYLINNNQLKNILVCIDIKNNINKALITQVHANPSVINVLEKLLNNPSLQVLQKSTEAYFAIYKTIPQISANFSEEKEKRKQQTNIYKNIFYPEIMMNYNFSQILQYQKFFTDKIDETLNQGIISNLEKHINSLDKDYKQIQKINEALSGFKYESFQNQFNKFTRIRKKYHFYQKLFFEPIILESHLLKNLFYETYWYFFNLENPDKHTYLQTLQDYQELFSTSITYIQVNQDEQNQLLNSSSQAQQKIEIEFPEYNSLLQKYLDPSYQVLKFIQEAILQLQSNQFLKIQLYYDFLSLLDKYLSLLPWNQYVVIIKSTMTQKQQQSQQLQFIQKTQSQTYTNQNNIYNFNQEQHKNDTNNQNNAIVDFNYSHNNSQQQQNQQSQKQQSQSQNLNNFSKNNDQQQQIQNQANQLEANQLDFSNTYSNSQFQQQFYQTSMPQQNQQIDFIEFYEQNETLIDVKLKIYRNKYFGTQKPVKKVEHYDKQNNKNQQLINIQNQNLNHNQQYLQNSAYNSSGKKSGGLKSLLINLDDKKTKEIFYQNYQLDKNPIGKKGRVIIEQKPIQHFNKQLQVNIDLPFNKSNVIITQSDNIIAEYYFQQHAEDLSQYQTKEIPFQPDSYLFQPITININQVKDYENQINAGYSTQRSKRSQGVTPRGQTSPNSQLLKNQQQKNKGFKNHHEVQNSTKNDVKNNKNKNNQVNTNHNYIDEEEEDDQDESKIFASFEDFERINVEREILVSAINPIIQFDSVPVTLYEHEQWKMYSKFDIGMILGHEIRIIDPRNKEVVGVVNGNQNEWNGIVFEDFSSIVMQEMTIINYQQYSNEPIEDLNQYQFWFIIDCRQEIGNMAKKNYKIFLQGMDVNNEFVSYKFDQQSGKNASNLNGYWILGYVQNNQFFQKNTFVKDIFKLVY